MLSCVSNKISEKNFRRSYGVTKNTFNDLLKKIKSVAPNKKTGPKKSLSFKKQLTLTLDYWRNYNTLLVTGEKYGVSESTACRNYKFIENCLAKAGVCKLPGKKEFTTDAEGSFTVDATECPIERPKRKPNARIKNKQKHWYSGKKKKHTYKAQIIIKGKTIQSTAFGNGKKHDYKLFKKSRTKFRANKNVKMDSGYQGHQKVHPNTDLPIKKTKKLPLTKEQKLTNKNQASQRVVVEHVIGSIKKFKILNTRYRNRRKRFGLRFNLICGIYNLENQELI